MMVRPGQPDHDGHPSGSLRAELSFLDKQAEGLDLPVADDRAIFRSKVADATALTKVSAMREWIGAQERDRYTVTRAVADAYIALAQARRGRAG